MKEIRDKFYYTLKETIYDKTSQTFRNISRVCRLLKSILILSVRFNAREREGWEREGERNRELEDWEGRSHDVAVRWRGLIERVFPQHTREKFFRKDKLLFSLSVPRWKLSRNFRERFTKDSFFFFFLLPLFLSMFEYNSGKGGNGFLAKKF